MNENSHSRLRRRLLRLLLAIFGTNALLPRLARGRQKDSASPAAVSPGTGSTLQADLLFYNGRVITLDQGSRIRALPGPPTAWEAGHHIDFSFCPQYYDFSVNQLELSLIHTGPMPLGRDLTMRQSDYYRTIIVTLVLLLMATPGQALDHLIARYGIETQWPPRTNWSYQPGVDASEASWSSEGGPQFAKWSVDFNFAEGVHLAPVAQAPRPQAASLTMNPAQMQAVAQPAALDLPAGISPGDTCAGKPEGSSCWMELGSPPGCYLWNHNLQVNETATWSGTCAGGLAEGTGEIVWVSDSDRENSQTNTGQMQQGKHHGRWVFRGADGSSSEGPYMDGKRHGRWVIRFAKGDVEEGPYVDGKRHGRWIERWHNGVVMKGMYVDGKKQGLWPYRNREGEEGELNFVDGELRF